MGQSAGGNDLYRRRAQNPLHRDQRSAPEYGWADAAHETLKTCKRCRETEETVVMCVSITKITMQ